VLFPRLWRNGQFDSEVAITARNEDGSWDEPSMSAGGPWIDDPLIRPARRRDDLRIPVSRFPDFD
jgi:hypothetical protein